MVKGHVSDAVNVLSIRFLKGTNNRCIHTTSTFSVQSTGNCDLQHFYILKYIRQEHITSSVRVVFVISCGRDVHAQMTERFVPAFPRAAIFALRSNSSARSHLLSLFHFGQVLLMCKVYNSLDLCILLLCVISGFPYRKKIRAHMLFVSSVPKGRGRIL